MDTRVDTFLGPASALPRWGPGGRPFLVSSGHMTAWAPAWSYPEALGTW